MIDIGFGRQDGHPHVADLAQTLSDFRHNGRRQALKGLIEQEEDPELDFIAQGETADEAKKNLFEVDIV